MNRDCAVQTIVDSIAAYAGAEFSITDENTAAFLARMWLDDASAYCRRSDYPSAMIAIVQDTVISAYNKRGDEGMTSSGVGGQSVQYEDLAEVMHKRLSAAGMRVYKL